MKARDIIPGWPRGRSTSRPLEDPLKLILARCPCVLNESAASITYGPDHRKMQDWAEDRVEELRKADMMDGWYELKRQEARGPFYPSQSENFGYGFLVSPEIFECVSKMREFDEMLTGGRYLFGLDMASEDKS